MAVDPQVQAILDAMAAMEAPPFEEMTVEQARAMAGAMAFGPPPDIAETADLEIPGPAGPIPARLYRPIAGERLPVVVFFHGGGWVIGDIESHDATCRELATASGCAVIAVDYRLAPEHPFPAAIDDAYAATAWIASHGDELNVDADRLAVAGDSAGGNISAVVALLARDAGGPSIALQALIYPATDCSFERPSMIENGEGYMLTTAGLRWFWGHYLGATGDPGDWRASPLRAADFAGVAPALVITAGYDPLRDEGAEYAAALERAGVDVTYTNYPGMIHGFFQMTAMLDEAKKAMAAVGDALGTALGRRPEVVS